MNKEIKNNIGFFLSIIMFIVFSFIAGFLIKSWLLESKIENYEKQITDLKTELSQYKVTEDMLLPCPWCNSEDLEFDETFGSYYVKCHTCGATSPTHSTSENWMFEDDLTKEDALEHWNSLQR